MPGVWDDGDFSLPAAGQVEGRFSSSTRGPLGTLICKAIRTALHPRPLEITSGVSFSRFPARERAAPPDSLGPRGAASPKFLACTLGAPALLLLKDFGILWMSSAVQTFVIDVWTRPLEKYKTDKAIINFFSKYVNHVTNSSHFRYF